MKQLITITFCLLAFTLAGQNITSTQGSVGTTAQRPTAPNFGEYRFNSETASMEWYDGSNWVSMITGAGTNGTVPLWTGTATLGNSAITQSGQEIAMGLTGALTVPTGTDAEVPVWGNGKLRYNTTSGGFQGGASGYYLPYSNTPTFTTGSILYSNGSRLLEDNSGIFYDASGDELRLGGTTDRGNYDLQLNSQGLYIQSAFPAIRINTGGIEFGGTQYTALISGTTSVGNALINVENQSTSSPLSVALRAISRKPSIIATGSSSSEYTALLVSSRRNGGASSGDYNNVAEVLRITTESFFNEDPTNGYGMLEGGGLALDWNYKTNSTTDYRWKAGRIVPIVINSNEDNLEDSELAFYAAVNKVLTKIMALDSAGIKLPLYASGALTGTPNVQSASFNSNGRIISRKFAYAEMLINDIDPDTISITAGTPAEGTDWTAGELANFTYSAGRLTYSGTETAKFHIHYSSSITHSVNSTNIEAWVYENGSEVAKSHSIGTVITAGNIVPISHSCIVELSTNDYIELFYDASNGGDVVVYTSSITIEKI